MKMIFVVLSIVFLISSGCAQNRQLAKIYFPVKIADVLIDPDNGIYLRNPHGGVLECWFEQKKPRSEWGLLRGCRFWREQFFNPKSIQTIRR